MIEIPDQEHKISISWWNIQTIRLRDLFQEYGENVKQIIRLRPNIFAEIQEKDWECVNLFNLCDPVNDRLISEYEAGSPSQAIVTEVHGPEVIIQESSIIVTDVLEMQNITPEQIEERQLYTWSISQTKSVSELYGWLGNTFYTWLEIDPEQELLFRKIQTIT